MQPESKSTSGGEDLPSGVAVPPEPKDEAAPKRRSGLLTVGLLLTAAAAIAGLVLTNFKDSTVYAKGIDQVVAEKGKWAGRNLRVEGTMVRGSLKFQEKPCLWEFDATRNGATLHVKFAGCIKPDNLADRPDMPDVGVTVEGKLAGNGEFAASNILTKCPSKYDMKPPSGAAQDKSRSAVN